jgi:dGTPase
MSMTVATTPERDKAVHPPAPSEMTWQARASGAELQRARSDYRNPYARDRARIIHSSALRRLQGKTQVPGLVDADLPRTWHTHAMEVAQLSRGMLRALQGLYPAGVAWREWLPDVNLLEAIAFGRSLGRPPFGEVGEQTLDSLLSDAGGYDHRAQATRVVICKEPHTDAFGLDLTRRTMLGLVTRPAAQHRPAHHADETALMAWLLQPLSVRDQASFLAPADGQVATAAATLDASMVSLAQDIAHGVHALEDAMALGLVGRVDWDALPLEAVWATAVDLGSGAQVGDALFGPSPAARKRAIGSLINALVVSVDVESDASFDEALLRHRVQLMAPAHDFLSALQAVVHQGLHASAEVQAAGQRGGEMLRALFHAWCEQPALAGSAELEADCQHAKTPARVQRLVADHLAGLTDVRVERLWRQLGDNPPV